MAVTSQGTPAPTKINPLDPAGAAELAKYLQSQLAPGGTSQADLITKAKDAIYDPSALHAEIARLTQITQGMPTEADTAASNAALHEKGVQYLYDQIKGIQAPQEQAIAQPNLPQLTLPDQPQTARPQQSILGQLLSIGAGFAAPQHAGEFNAAGLEGAIKGAQEENARRQMMYKNDVAGRAMLYDAAMSSAKEHERITESNRDTAYRNSAANIDHQLSIAKTSSELYMAHGAAESLQKFAKENDPKILAMDKITAAYKEIAASGKASTETVNSIAKLVEATNKSAAPNAMITGKIIAGIIANAEKIASDNRQDIRSEHHDIRTENAAMARTQDTIRGQNARLEYSEGQTNTRQQNEHTFKANNKPPAPSVRQKYLGEMRKEQEKLIGQLEATLAGARAKRAEMQGKDIKKGTTASGQDAVVNDLISQVRAARGELKKLQDASDDFQKNPYEGDGKSKLKFSPMPLKMGAKVTSTSGVSYSIKKISK